MSLHQKCLSLVPPSATGFLQASLLCGENLTVPDWKSALVRTSLIHIFIVSGSHLILLEQVLSWIRVPLAGRLVIWTLYSFACGWQAPLVRALAGALLRVGEKRGGIFWPRDISILVSGLIVLVLFPEWTNSRSLLMSWVAALALSASSLITELSAPKRLLLVSSVAYLVMLPLLWGFGSLHPLAILYNVFLGLPVTFGLWPLSLLCLVIPPLQPALDAASGLFLRTLQLFSEPVAVESTYPLGMEILWAFLLGLHALIHFLRVQRKRSRP